MFEMDEDVEKVDEISSKTWDVMESKMMKAGFREGIGAGRELVFQPSFDEGYRIGFEMGYKKAYLQGFMSVLSAEKPEVNGEETTPPSQPTCSICVDNNRDKFNEQPMSEVVKSVGEKDEHYVDLLEKEHSAWIKKLGIEFASSPPKRKE